MLGLFRPRRCQRRCLSAKTLTPRRPASSSEAIYLTQSPATSTLLSQLLPSVFVDCLPPPHPSLPLPPLMDFHSQFSRKAELLASFLIHLSHPIPPPVSRPSPQDSCGHLCSCPLWRKVPKGWLITGRTWVWEGDAAHCEPPTHPQAAAEGPVLWFSGLAVRARGRGHSKEFQGRTDNR